MKVAILSSVPGAAFPASGKKLVPAKAGPCKNKENTRRHFLGASGVCLGIIRPPGLREIIPFHE
jgi:hypothetical protein